MNTRRVLGFLVGALAVPAAAALITGIAWLIEFCWVIPATLFALALMIIFGIRAMDMFYEE